MHPYWSYQLQYNYTLRPVFRDQGPSAPRRRKKHVVQLGTVGSTSDVGGIYVFVSVTNSGILTRNMPKLAFFLQFYLTY